MDCFWLLRQSVPLWKFRKAVALFSYRPIYGIVGNDQRIYQGANLPQLYAGAQRDEQKKIYSHSVYAAAKGAVISLTRTSQLIGEITTYG
jgi:hypothetical protein